MRIWPMDGEIEWSFTSTSLDRKRRYSPQLGGGRGGRRDVGSGHGPCAFYGVSQSLGSTCKFYHQDAALFSRKPACGSAPPQPLPSSQLSPLCPPEPASGSETLWVSPPTTYQAPNSNKNKTTLPMVRHRVSAFQVLSFDPENKPTRQILGLSPFYR